jgi:hypothetical protein
LSFSDSMRSGWIGRQLRRMFLDKDMIEVAVVPHPVFIGFEFLGLLIGGHLTRAQRAGTLEGMDLKRWWDNLRDADASGPVKPACLVESPNMFLRSMCTRLQDPRDCVELPSFQE